MPAARINSALRSGGVVLNTEETTKQIQLALAEIFSNKNLGLNLRIVSTDMTMDVSDSVIVGFPTAPSNYTVTLPPCNSWSVENPIVYKTPILTLCNALAAGATMTVAADAMDAIAGYPSGYPLTPGSTIQLISSNLNQWVVLSSGGNSMTQVVLSTPGTANFTWPSGVEAVTVTMIGGGGAGGGSSIAQRAGGGGGGELVYRFIYHRNGASTTSYTVGAGGTGVAGGTGGNGGTTSFGTLQVQGGQGGRSGTGGGLGGMGQGFTAGSTTNAALGVTGVSGLFAAGSTFLGGSGGGGGTGGTGGTHPHENTTGGVSAAARGGGGAASYFGNGGNGSLNDVNGVAASATSYGAGGGGGGGNATVNTTGGNGGTGLIIVEY